MSYNIVLNIKLIPNALFIMSWSMTSPKIALQLLDKNKTFITVQQG